MRLMASIIALLLIALIALPAAAQTVFKWVDEDGEIHYGHSLPPEYVDLAHERLSEGEVRESVDRALTLEEREAAMAAMAAERAQEAAERTRQTQDRLLLASYSSEDEILQAKQSELTVIRSQISSASASLNNALHRYRQLISQAADLERAASTVPDNLAERIRDSHAELAQHQSTLDRINRRIQRTEESFQQDLDRYRDLSGGG